MSPGRGVFRIPTLVPAQKPDGSCLFLNQDRRCEVHKVSPFGCAMFDSHQLPAESDRRSKAGLIAVMQDHRAMGLYSALWQNLHSAGLCSRAPESLREAMKASWQIACEQDDR